MGSRTRIFILALLLLFAVGIVVQSASATSMALMMAFGEADAGEMTDCQDCDGAESGSNCDIVCIASFAADIGEVDAFVPRFAEATTLQSPEHLAGQTGPPEPHPPRTLI